LNSLIEKYPQDVQKILGKYPADQKRAAVMPLLYLAQRELGYVTRQALVDIASLLEISSTEVASIVGFYTLYHGEAGGKYRIQVCNDLPCALRGADDFLQKLCENLGIRVGETTADGLVTLEAVTCLAGCDRAPMFQVQTGDGLTYHENQTVESTLALVEQWKSEAEAARAAALAAEPADAPETLAGDMLTVEAGEQEEVLVTAEQGITRQPADKRIHIQELGGQ
jgi:NADH-quinone oxidoreductase subunit E